MSELDVTEMLEVNMDTHFDASVGQADGKETIALSKMSERRWANEVSRHTFLCVTLFVAFFIVQNFSVHQT